MHDTMKRWLVLALALGVCSGNTAAPEPGWTPAEITTLKHWVAAAPEDALPVLPTHDLDQALAGPDHAAIDQAATRLALALARIHLRGATVPTEGQDWHMVDTDARIDIAAQLGAVLAGSGGSAALDRFFAGARPQSPDYAILRTAYASERDPARRATLVLNMERWRWMPRSLAPDHIEVNTASFEVSLWRQGHRVGAWPVVVGKPKSPTPVFSAEVSGVTFNPWWDVPADIARESIIGLMRRHPALARQRGYVHTAGRYRQRPGPANALGQMKLVMPNPFNVYLHDTPEKKLFARDVRAFSHGCVRVGDALGFATALMQGTASADAIKAIVATGRTTTVELAARLPVYVTYFTATTHADGTLALLPDVYGRDADQGHADDPAHDCAG